MDRIFFCRLNLILSVCIITLLLPCTTQAASCEQWVAKAVSVQGNVEARRAGQAQWQSVRLNDTYCPGDMIRVNEQSRAALSLVNQPLLRLDQNTTITLGGVKQKKTSVVELARGAVHFFSRIRRNLEVMTGFVNAGVEGTEGFIRVEEDRTFLSIFDGQVLASNAAGSLTLTSGQSAVAEAGKAPVLRVVVRPRDAVQWALYYLPVMYVPLREAPNEDPRDPRFLVYRASQLLAVGRVDEADADIRQALNLDPGFSDAYALQAIVFVVQNEKDRALDAAKRAVETGPRSATARIAMSYAHQADFDLEGARASIEEALKLDPDNALAWSRLAELWSSFGRIGKALDAAKRAVELEPKLSRTQMVLGFAYLTQVQTTAARAAFEKAIALDQADPLSRLGLGLAIIRDGDLDAGGREIEIAASLDPNNSLVRSYLGKVYFEQKQIGLDEREYAIAKELDPNDPTPWFYDAIAKQTTNRPVEALQDLQKARELNDNRGVYRSRLMLDSDLAARSAALGRIYSNLGFQERALFEGWMAVNTDPTNFSAHRFLADSYAVRPRHEIARVSELLQSQLLQPINITPIQPRLAESNQFLISSGGPGTLSFNEFNPIFNRNRLAVQGSGLAGENETYGGEGVASGIYNKLSFSSGYTYFDTDGWRKNADQNDKIFSVFSQFELSYKTSIQAEYRYRDNDYGDLQQRYFDSDFFPGQTNEENRDTFRLGGKHSFSPDSILLSSFIYQNTEFRAEDDEPLVAPGFITQIRSKRPVDSYAGEMQYLYRSNAFNFVGGGGHAYLDDEIKTKTDTILGPGTSQIDEDLKHTNAYAYSYIKPSSNLTLTAGISGDFTSGDSPDVGNNKKINPKFGITWSPFTNTTLRAAAFKAFKRTLVTDQTLEPTQVAGFNQFYDDFNGTDAWRFGGAIDQKLSSKIFAGGEFAYRELDVPATDQSGNETEVDWNEYLGKAYLFWTPHEWLALRAEYQYERFKRDKDLTDGIRKLNTHRVPLGINFFHPSGLSASLQGTYFYQDGRFERIPGGGPLENDNGDFVLVDAAINYRLPKRYGLLTLGVTNLFDDDFDYFEVDFDNPQIQPDRVIFGKITLALP
ncbi:MAG: tetratricopeptide repeat protein [Desulfobacterales bacterium]|jgi:tetratricopeptide (TPR) repeat protein